MSCSKAIKLLSNISKQQELRRSPRRSGSSIISTLRLAKAEAARCLGCSLEEGGGKAPPPCSAACPAQTDPAKFLRQVHLDNPVGATETIYANNPLGGICGAVCPVSRLCEGVCIRNRLDGRPVRIGAVQEFLAREYSDKIRPPASAVSPTSQKKKTVAIIGSGPAGLSAARELQRSGYQVTIFEGRSEPGGGPRYFLSPCRVDRDLLQREIHLIADSGVSIVCNHPVQDLSTLRDEFDHVIVSAGLQTGKMPHDMQEHGAVSALEFLESSNTETAELARALAHDKRVVVVGGGSVAMDAAVTAASTGASRVVLVCLESLQGIPACQEEVELARQHHVIFIPESRARHWDATTGRLEIQSVNNPQETSVLHVDSLLFAIGQDHDPITKEMLLNQYGVIYAGDVSNGGATVVQAVSEGKQAAERISGMSLKDFERQRRIKDEEALRIDFCGIAFPNPFCLSSSPVTNTAEMCARAFEAGWGGAVYKTLNREQDFRILHPSPRLAAVHDQSESHRLGVGLQNIEQISDRPLLDNLKDIEWIKTNYPDNILGVSIMGFSEDSWQSLARDAQRAGADWLELNFSCPQMHHEGGGHRVGQDAELIERFTRAAKTACGDTPVVAKMTPNLADMVPYALAAQRGGADGVSAINTFRGVSHIEFHPDSDTPYQPQPNIERQSSISGFSGPACRPLALRFIAELAQDERLTIPISGMGGIFTWRDAAEFLSLGASNLQCTTAVMRHGVRIVDDLKDGLLRHMRDMNYTSVSQLVGASLPHLVSPEQLDLTTEAVSHIDPELCIGCGACVTSCRDGATNAISLRKGDDGGSKAWVDPQKCVGCLLCSHVCPVQGAVQISTRARIAR
jgi:dihydropyrimidine dehydrogenase (NAD+) subunit PreA